MTKEELEKKRKINKQCKQCRFSWCVCGVSTEPVCLYILETGKRRECDPENCIRFERRTKKRTHIGKVKAWY